MASIVIDLGRQFPLFGYHKAPAPERGYVRQINFGLISIALFPYSIVAVIEGWKQIARREAWAAYAGIPTDNETEMNDAN